MLEIQAKSIKLRPILLIICVGVIATIPAILCGIVESHDLIWAHIKWSKHFIEQFWQGDFYPRWLINMNAGLGGASFFFYPPIAYYFTSLFHPLFAHDASGWHQLGLSALLATVASGITAYIWLKNISSQKSALIASLVYMTLPYHLAIDLYWRFAFAEYWSFVWLPLILFFTSKIINCSKLNTLGLAVSYALLIMTHLLTMVIFSLIPLSYILLIAGRHERKKALIRLLVAMILALGLSAIYWVPALTTQEYVSLSEIYTGNLFYGGNFLFWIKNVGFEDFWRYLEVTTPLMGVLAYNSFSIARTNSTGKVRRESTYWFAVALIAVFMTLPLSQPLWHILPIVQKIQFPWRFNTVLTVATTALLALGFSSLEPQLKLANKKLAFSILLFASLLLAGIQVLVVQSKIKLDLFHNSPLIIAINLLLAVFIAYLKKPVNFFQYRYLVIVTLLTTSLLLGGGLVMGKQLGGEKSDLYTELKISKDTPEYRPRWVPKEIFTPDKVSQLGSISSKARVSEGQGSVSIEQWKPRKIVLQTNATTDIGLTINQFYYPGWAAKIAGKSDLLAVQPSKPEGLLRVALPSGKHQVIVTLNAGVEERTGQIISAVSGIIALFSIFWLRKVERDSVNYNFPSMSEQTLLDQKKVS